MSIGILGQKVGMTRVYDEAGTITPVTVILAEPNSILQVKTIDNDGYNAVQLGVFDQKEHRVTKPRTRPLQEAAGCAPKKFVGEFTTEGEERKHRDTITVTNFKAGQIVDVIGISKGKGFQGPMKKHNFDGQGAAHGSKTHRRNGSPSVAARLPDAFTRITAWPVTWGDERVTVQNLRVVQVREADHVLLVSGAVPGATGSYVVVRTAIKGQPKPKGAANGRQGSQPDEGLQGRQISQAITKLHIHELFPSLHQRRQHQAEGRSHRERHRHAGAARKPWSPTRPTVAPALTPPRPRPPWPAPARSPGAKKAPVTPVPVTSPRPFGPAAAWSSDRIPRKYTKKTNKVVKQLALKKAISSRVNAGEVYLIDPISLAKPKHEGPPRQARHRSRPEDDRL